MPRGRPTLAPAKSVLRVLLPALAFAVLVTGGLPERAPSVTRDPSCGDLMHPLQVTVTPTAPVRPGAVVTASVEIAARVDLDGVTLRLASPADVTLLSNPGRGLGRFRAGDRRTETISVIAPRGAARRVVEVLVEGSVDGAVVTRGAVLNLVFEEEPSRIVTTPDGRQVREVRARRVG